jgi:hypothetical protein
MRKLSAFISVFVLATTLAPAANINYNFNVGRIAGNPNEALQITNFASVKPRIEINNGSPSVVAPTTVSGIFSLLEDDATPKFHFGGTVTCSVNSAAACLPLDIPVQIAFSSDISILVDQILFNFDATFFPTNPASNINVSVGYFGLDVLGATPPYNFNYFTNTTQLDLTPGISIANNSVGIPPRNVSGVDYALTLPQMVQMAGQGLVNATTIDILLSVSGMRPGDILSFPNSFTLGIGATAIDPVPEPATVGFVATAGLLFWALRRRS